MRADEKPALRRMIRRYLAERSTAAQEASVIHFFIAGQMPCQVEDVEDALEFLAGLQRPEVKFDFDPMGGATRYWQITSEGILAHERGR